MKEFISVSPLKILEKSSRGELGPGNLGVLIARAGVGKTACLIHIALDKIFRRQKLIHASLEAGPEKVTSFYSVIYSELVKVLDIKDPQVHRLLIDKNRMILAYLNQSFKIDHLRRNIKNLIENLDFKPDALILDGLDFERTERSLFKDFKNLAQVFGVEIWFSALSHRHITETNKRGIPYPCLHIDALFNIIIHLQPEPSGIALKLLKDHEGPPSPPVAIRLDPNTLLALD